MHALEQHPRRVILTRLLADDTPHDLDSFDSTQIAGCSRTELHHIHLPVLEQAGLIEWEPATAVLARGPSYADIEPFLRLLARDVTDPDR